MLSVLEIELWDIAVKRNMGTSGEDVGLEQGDFDGDGKVDWDDLQMLMGMICKC
ncbi:MAG: hypothetical protein ABH840_04555 [Nanoarchaeota archaeon]